MGYDFVIEHKCGAENMVADALSKRDEDGELIALSQPIPRWLDPIKEENCSHPQLQHFIKLCQEGEALGPWEYHNGVLFFKGCIY